jgi:hypothetical protein
LTQSPLLYAPPPSPHGQTREFSFVANIRQTILQQELLYEDKRIEDKEISLLRRKKIFRSGHGLQSSAITEGGREGATLMTSTGYADAQRQRRMSEEEGM